MGGGGGGGCTTLEMELMPFKRGENDKFYAMYILSRLLENNFLWKRQQRAIGSNGMTERVPDTGAWPAPL